MKHFTSISIALTVLILTLSTAVVFGQTTDWQQLQYKAYLSQNVSLWHQSFKLAAESKDQWVTGLAGYGILNATLSLQNEDLFDEYLEDTSDPLGAIIDSGSGNTAEAKAIMSGILGLRIAYAPMKGMFLGGKSASYAEAAIKEAPDSYITWKLFGNYKFYTPGAFGGDISEAAKALEKSIALIEQNPAHTVDNWMYIDAMAHLGQCYTQLGQKEKARAIYNKALKVEPNYTWVSRVLLPHLQEQ